MSRTARSRPLFSKMALAPASVASMCTMPVTASAAYAQATRSRARDRIRRSPPSSRTARSSVMASVRNARAAPSMACPSDYRVHRLTSQHWRTKTGLIFHRLLCERGNRTACYSQRRTGNRPRKDRQARYPINNTWLCRHRRDQVVGVVGRYKGVRHLKVAASGAAKTRDVPGVMNGHLLARKVAENRRSAVAAAIIPYRGQAHKSGCMATATAERPSSRDEVAAGNGLGRTDRARRGNDEGVGVGKPVACNGFGKITSDPAHAAAICHDPANRAIERGCRFHHLHEL